MIPGKERIIKKKRTIINPPIKDGRGHYYSA